ncbi:uncharacterized protein si:ch211-198p11.6 [Lampris incognitus]|uniref:uncharacterized protein si:ch211-198p11.6 n=1 Tax=Lampris incognitus TaxID=2546036 RepID=UPI0024B4B62F|nr:uncharacterized protein si:ch211-198p11.6 [Lampris incognitus]XP_056144715.1 uncharacterized protein si:ch211-198p11.6 [Lampris incognitus]
MSSQTETMVVLPIWGLSLPLPAVLIITVGLYMVVVAMALWFRHCLKDQCSFMWGECCPNISPCEQCFAWAESCDCRPPSLRSCLDQTCPSPSCAGWDCACTCQPPECESCNCLCFEIKIR